MDIVRGMKVFVRIVDSGSIAAAAAHFDLSPTMLGNHLQSLEQHLGARLINRTTRRHSLTSFGRKYYERSVEILSMIESAETLALEAQSDYKGQLRISAPIIWTSALLIPALADYLRSYPGVDLDVIATDKNPDLDEEGLEAAIRFGNCEANDLIAVPLVGYAHVLCASPGYVNEHGMPRSEADLGSHQGIVYRYPRDNEWWSPKPCWDLLGPEGRITIFANARIRIDSTYSMYRAALNGLGVAMLPEVLVAADLEAGRLVHVMQGFVPVPRPVNLVYRRDRRMSRKLASLVGFMTESFGAQRQAVAGEGIPSR